MTKKGLHKILLSTIFFLMVVIGSLVFLPPVSWGETWKIPAEWGFAADSAIFRVDTNGVARDSQFWSATLYGIDTTVTVSGANTYMVAVRIFPAGEDSAMTWAWFHDNDTAIAAGSGSGTNAIVIYALDTSGTDAVIADVKLTVTTPGSQTYAEFTGADGYYSFGFDDAEGYSIIGRGAGYIFDAATFNVSGANDSLALLGYDLAGLIGVSDEDSVCRVFGFIEDLEVNPVPRAEVVLSVGADVFNACRTTSFLTTVVAYTNDDGLFFIDVPYSTCLRSSPTATDSAQYTITVQRLHFSKTVTVWVPKQDTFRVVF